MMLAYKDLLALWKDAGPGDLHPETSQGAVCEAAVAGESAASSLAVCRWFTKSGDYTQNRF
jgi:hypothetical protein